MTRHSRMLWTIAVVGAMSCQAASAADTREYVENGVQYRETRHTVARAVPVTEYRDHTQLHWRSQITTETHDRLHTVHTPVTEYQWVTRLHGRWNPFVQPYYSQQFVPVTRWHAQTQVVSTLVTRHQMVPEVKTVKVPVTQYRIANEEVTHRVAVAGVGGLAKLENDPPRSGSQLGSGTGARR